jgi:hypothetical protein
MASLPFQKRALNIGFRSHKTSNSLFSHR